MTDWVRSSSDHRPETIDTTSSPTTVYERKDIHSEEVTDNMGMMEGEEPVTRTQWVYMERTYTQEEYKMLKAMQERIELRHDSDVIDQYTEELIEAGVL